MIYVALLRGINVGGNNKIAMVDLKQLFKSIGCENVATYINSGNVVFTTDRDPKSIRLLLEKELTKQFHYDARLILASKPDTIHILKNVPDQWRREENLRCNIGFLWETEDPTTAIKQIKINEEVDSITIGPQVIYMTTAKNMLSKSRFNKLVGTKIYKQMTIRTHNTVMKIQEIMDSISY